MTASSRTARIVPDGLEITPAERERLRQLKQRAVAQGRRARKRELLRAGLVLLADLDADQLVAALNALPPLKRGGRQAALPGRSLLPVAGASAEPMPQSETGPLPEPGPTSPATGDGVSAGADAGAPRTAALTPVAPVEPASLVSPVKASGTARPGGPRRAGRPGQPGKGD